MKKIIYAVLCAVLMLVPFGVLINTALVKTPAQYDETFLGELSEKHERLSSVDEPKIILIGGSNLAFGVDSELLEQYVGMPVVNYGLYAAIGTKAMLDMSENHIKEGDIVVICPETDAQTYSLYYNGESMWQALDADMTMLRDAGVSNYPELFATLPRFSAAKLEFYNSGKKPGASGIYSRDSFNQYGDISVERKYNEMPKNYDSTTPVSISTDIIGDGFIEYLNDYAFRAKLRGADVYFSFSPMNESAVVTGEAEKEEFYLTLGENLDFPVISDIDSYILKASYFYDSNFHLNTRGAQLRTALLADDILRETGKTEYVETIKYTPPKRPENYFDTETEDGSDTDPNAEYFVYEKTEGGVIITGLSEKGRGEKVLTVPAYSPDGAVIELGKAFAKGGILETLIIPENTSLRTIANRAFSETETLSRVEIYALPEKLTAGSEAFDGMSGSCFIYVPEDNYGTFASDYFWGGKMAKVKQM